jgi:hypothetical protein
LVTGKELRLGFATGAFETAVMLESDAVSSRFVEYLTRDQAVRARSDLASYVVHERPIRVDVMRPIDFVCALG